MSQEGDMGSKEPEVESRMVVLGKNTLVPLGLLALLWTPVASFIGALFWIKTSLYAIDLKVSSIDSRLGEVVKETVKQKDLLNWVRLIKAQNPALNIPDL